MSGFVYAIECGDAVKIGYAKDPVRRLSELNVGSANTHRLVGFAAGTKQHEFEIRGLCRASRIRGEWFAKTGIVLEFLERLPSRDSLPERVKTRKPKGDAGLEQAVAKVGSAQTLSGLIGV